MSTDWKGKIFPSLIIGTFGYFLKNWKDLHGNDSISHILVCDVETIENLSEDESKQYSIIRRNGFFENFLNLPLVTQESKEFSTSIIKIFEKSYDFIKKGRTEGSGVFLCCSSGLSSSAAIAIAFITRDLLNTSLKDAFDLVKYANNKVRPNDILVQYLKKYYETFHLPSVEPVKEHEEETNSLAKKLIFQKLQEKNNNTNEIKEEKEVEKEGKKEKVEKKVEKVEKKVEKVEKKVENQNQFELKNNEVKKKERNINSSHKRESKSEHMSYQELKNQIRLEVELEFVNQEMQDLRSKLGALEQKKMQIQLLLNLCKEKHKSFKKNSPQMNKKFNSNQNTTSFPQNNEIYQNNNNFSNHNSRDALTQSEEDFVNRNLILPNELNSFSKNNINFKLEDTNQQQNLNNDNNEILNLQLNNNEILNLQLNNNNLKELENINTQVSEEGINPDFSNRPTKYCCRKCRFEIFTDKDIQLHKKGKGQGQFKLNKRSQKNENQCTSIFLEYEKKQEWLTQECFETEGKLFCPKCGSKIGSYNWAGNQCSCGGWQCPSFQVHLSNIDAKQDISLIDLMLQQQKLREEEKKE